MKKVLLFAISAVIIFGLTSCNKKAENLADLKKKYDGKEFADCDKYIEAAKKEFEEFTTFMENFDGDETKFQAECPEKLEAFEKEVEKKMEAVLPQLMTLMFGEMDLGDDFSWDETEDVDVESEEVLTDVPEEEVVE